MKRYMKQLGICLLALCLGLLLCQCEDDYLMIEEVQGSGGENSTPQLPSVSISSITNITSSTASCGGNVTSDGGAVVTARGFCWSTQQYPTISNIHTTNGSGTGSFGSSLTGLSSGTTYYVRAYATNSQGTSYSAQKSFTTSTSGGGAQSRWLAYDDGNFEKAYGFAASGYCEWAVMFPSSMLGQYNNIRVSKIEAYFHETGSGSYSLKIYNGSYESPNSLLSSQSISVSGQGWKTISISQISISNSKCLWISLGKSFQPGEYPLSTAAGSNNPYARFIKASNDWYDFYDIKNDDVTWMIRAYITYTNAKSGKVEEKELSQEMDLPQMPKANNVNFNIATQRTR